MRRALVGLLLLAVGCTPSSRPRPDATPAPTREFAPLDPDAPPIKATLLSMEMGKPPQRYYNVRLSLVNRHDRAIWLVFPRYADDALPASPVFPTAGLSHPPFDGKAVVGEGRAVEIDMFGDPGFRAFFLPPRGQVEFNSYSFGAWKDTSGIEAWEVAALKVDEKTPLDRWLPYATLSDAFVYVEKSDPAWSSLDWDSDSSRGRDDYPPGPVRSVTAEVIGRWQIPFRE